MASWTLRSISLQFHFNVATSTGKTKEDVEALFNAGVFKVEDLKEGGWITGIKYVDEVSVLRICMQVPGLSINQFL